jgi:hypothetical protein
MDVFELFLELEFRNWAGFVCIRMTVFYKNRW